MTQGCLIGCVIALVFFIASVVWVLAVVGITVAGLVTVLQPRQ